MSGINRQGNRFVSGKSKQLNASNPRQEWKAKPKIEGSSNTTFCSQKDKEESFVESVPCEVQNVKLTESLLNEDSSSKKVNDFMDKNKEKDDVDDMKNIKSVEALLDEDCNSKKLEQSVVSFSLGDSAEFLYGEARDVEKAEKVTLESGDVLIFGGKSRLIFHGVTSIVPDTAPTWLKEATNMRPGRLNLTFRKY